MVFKRADGTTKKKPEKELLMKQRKLHKVGFSVMVALPPKFIKENDLKPGEMIAIIGRKDYLKIVPMPET